jgi:hypothetical protein
MPLVSKTMPSMVGGISQQPEALRLPSQAEEQLNCISSVVNGLGRRPSTEHVSKIQNGTLASATIHTIDRDENERYVVVFTAGNVAVYTTDGMQKTVAFPDGNSYLTASDPSTAFRATTIADHTFVVNRENVVAMNPTLTTTQTGEGLVFVKQGNYSSDYKIFVNGSQVASKTTADNSTATNANDIKTNNIASDLASALSGGLGGGYTITRGGSVIHIKNNAGTDFELSVEDSKSGTALYAFTTSTQNFSDLPVVAPTGYTLEVKGDDTTGFDNYYVKFEPSGSTDFSEGNWIETVKPGIKVGLDASTMPHILVRESTGDFTFKKATWTDRTVGDEETAPEPSFVGSKIRDIFFHKNRLGFLHNENYVLTKVSEFFTFFPSTVTTILDSDVIDAAVSQTSVETLNFGIPYQDSVLLFSESTQYILKGGDILSIETVSANPTTKFENSKIAKPILIGKSVYFANDKATSTGIRELFDQIETGEPDAIDVTAHIPTYIPRGLYKFAGSTNENLLCAITTDSDSKNTIYVYQFFWDGSNKLQSAWSKWTFGSDVTVLNIDFIENELFLVVQRADGVYLEKMNVSSDTKETDMDFNIYLDRKVDNSDLTGGTYDSATNITTYTLPYEVNAGENYKAVKRYGNLIPGEDMAVTSCSGSMLCLRGDTTITPFVFGEGYSSEYTYSKQNVKEDSRQGKAQSLIINSRLQLRTWSVEFNDTGYFRAEVSITNGDSFTYTFTGKIIGSSMNVIGQAALDNGTFRFPVLGKNTRVGIKLVNDSYFPSWYLASEWEGYLTSRSLRK